MTEYLSAEGTIVAHREYDPFGGTVVYTTAATNKETEIAFTHWFSTKPWCPVTGLSEYAMRKYSPPLGCWPSRDPIHELGFRVVSKKHSLPRDGNLYAYVRNSPIVFVDFLGLTTVTSTEAFCGATRMADGTYVLEVDDGWDGTVELRRITMVEIEAEKRRLVDRLRRYEERDGCKSRKYEGGFDSRYFEGENRQLQYYLVDAQCPIYAGNEINYIGIGLYEAWLCNPLWKAKGTVWLWKTIRWRDIPSEGTMHWLEVGYNNYATLKSADDTCCRCDGDTPDNGGGRR